MRFIIILSLFVSGCATLREEKCKYFSKHGETIEVCRPITSEDI
jgi:hypothetical protein